MLEAEAKSKYYEKVRILNDKKAEKKKKQLIKIRVQKEQNLAQTMQQRDYDIVVKKEMRDLKRQERQETVQRMHRQQEYQKSKILEKIVETEKRTQSLKAEKQSIMDLRMETRRQADNNMREISLKVEKIRAKGITP